MNAPNFAGLNRIEENLLSVRLDAVRLLISHAGEKGGELELQVRRLLKDVLPPEYGLTTGSCCVAFPRRASAVAISAQHCFA